MGDGGGPGEQLALVEQRREDGDVVLVNAAADPRVVAEEHVPSRIPGFSARFCRIHLTARSTAAASSVLYGPIWTISPSSSVIETSKSLQSVTTSEPRSGVFSMLRAVGL